ncbi:MAG: hypothetical protein ACLUOI_35820 [Eisenbergiella sp.]
MCIRGVWFRRRSQKRLDYAAPTGRVALTGWPNRPVELPTAVITRKELQIVGSRTGTTEEFAEAAEPISTGRVPAAKIISKIVSFEGARRQSRIWTPVRETG